MRICGWPQHQRLQQERTFGMHIFDSVLLMLDGDDAGRQGAAMGAHALAARLPVAVVSLDSGCQPDQLAPLEIQRIVSERDDSQNGATL
jgi:DNA primase